MVARLRSDIFPAGRRACLIFCLVSLFWPALAFTETSPNANANASGRLEKSSLSSALLGKDMIVYVYLPPGYSPDKTYPVVYLLHGYSNNEIEWFDYHHINQTADQLIAAGRVNPLVIVAPRMDNGWGIDSGSPMMIGDNPRRSLYRGPYESYFLKEVLPFVEAKYSVSRIAAGRSIGGLSMGGFSALHIGFRHPELFSRIGGHSPALRGMGIPNDFLYDDQTHPRPVTDPVLLAATADLSANKIWVDCGEQDSLLSGAKQLRDALKKRGLDYTFYSAPGAHNEDYWAPNMERYLLFYAGK